MHTQSVCLFVSLNIYVSFMALNIENKRFKHSVATKCGLVFFPNRKSHSGVCLPMFLKDGFDLISRYTL